MKTHFYICLILAACASAAHAQRRPSAAEVEQQANARVEFYRQQTEALTERVNAMQHDTAQLEQRVAQAETQLRAVAALQAENTRLRGEVKTLGEELAQVKADRETLRKQITDDIVAKITTVIEKQNAQRPQQNSSGKQTGREHVVEAGQTLSEIAAAYKTKIDVIVKANNMKDANSLRVGQKLFIPD